MNKEYVTMGIQEYTKKLESQENLTEEDVKRICELVREGLSIIELVEPGEQPIFNYFTEQDLYNVLDTWRTGMLIYSMIIDKIHFSKSLPKNNLAFVRANLELLDKLNYKVRGFRIKACKVNQAYNETLPKIDNLFKNNIKRSRGN